MFRSSGGRKRQEVAEPLEMADIHSDGLQLTVIKTLLRIVADDALRAAKQRLIKFALTV